MKWIDLLTPSAAALALLAAIALVVQSIRHGRQIRKLEQRLTEEGFAGGRPSLERIAALQERAGISQGRPRVPHPSPRRAAVVGGVAAVLAAAGAATWYFGFHDNGSAATPSARTSPGRQRTTTSPRVALDAKMIANPPALDRSKAAYTVLVLNGTSIDGAAAGKGVPLVENQGYATSQPGNAGRDLKASEVLWLPHKKDVAYNLAHDLGIHRFARADGIPSSQIGNADAVFVLGLDLAR